MERFDKSEYNAINDVLDAVDKTLSYYSFSYLGEGGQVHRFEQEFASWLGRRYSVAVNSGTSALLVAIKALTNDHVERIAVPAYTFVADAEAVVQCGHTPMFWDINKFTWCMDVYSHMANEDGIAIPVHTLGNASNCDDIKWFNKEVGFSIIEDCAQAVGTKWKNERVGTFGDIAVFSFQGTKTITTGEGGMLAMDDKELYERCCAIRNHGDYYRNTDFIGYNFRMTELQAAIGRCQLRKVNKFVASFKKNAKMIFDLLPDRIDPPYIPKQVDHGYFILGCTWTPPISKKLKFLDKLYKARSKSGLLFSKQAPDIPGTNQPPGYVISGGYRKPLYQIPLYHRYKRACPNTEEVIDKALWLDIHRWTDEDRIMEEMDIFNKVYSSCK